MEFNATKLTLRQEGRRGLLLNLYMTLVRPYLEYCMSALSPHYAKHEELLQKVQRRFIRMLKELKDNEYHRTLRYWSLEESSPSIS